MTTFVRLLEVDSDQKGIMLAEVAAQWRSGFEPNRIFQVKPSSFKQVPGSPLAYWVSERVRRLFTELPSFESGGRTAKVGIQTSDDFRFVRGWWEVDASALGKKWFSFAKGGAHSPFYADVHLVVNWQEEGREAKAWAGSLYGGSHWSRILKNVDFFFRPGLTWPRRTQLGLSIRAVGSGAVFGDKGPMVFPSDDGELPLLLGITTSLVFKRLVELQMAFGSYEVGVLQRTPLPDLRHSRANAVSQRARGAWSLKRSVDASTQFSHAFTLLALLRVDGTTLASRLRAWSAALAESQNRLSRIQAEIDDIAFALYGLDGEDRRQMEEGFVSLVSSEEGTGEDPEEEEEEEEDEDDDEVVGANPIALTEALLEWTLGVALGRFDVRLATGQRPPPLEPDPFDPLPVCSPGMLQDEAGLPATEAPSGYPLDLPPDGILVDDPGHPWDLVARLEAVLALVAGEHAHGWIQEAEVILGRDLRDWLRRYGFERHLKRYSRSRRKAPLFWHLAPKSRAYGVWLYSPVATRDTMYRILNDYVDPRLKGAERRLLELRQEAGAAPTGQQRRDLTSQESLVEELRVFREQVARVAPLWAPHRDDGVVLNCAVLWRLFDHHRGWQKDCKAKWGELAQGKYDWAGWAMHLWPERVVERCASDRSIAIAHGLEDALWQEKDDGKWKPHPDAKEQIAKQTAERRSPALQAALDTFTRAG